MVPEQDQEMLQYLAYSNISIKYRSYELKNYKIVIFFIGQSQAFTITMLQIMEISKKIMKTFQIMIQIYFFLKILNVKVIQLICVTIIPLKSTNLPFIHLHHLHLFSNNLKLHITHPSHVIGLQFDIFIMQNRKRLPSISFKQTQSDFDPPTRRRNLSLSQKYSPPNQVQLQRKTTTSIKIKNMGREYSKKNKLFLKSEKIRKARDLTKLCQDSVSEYIQLKNSVKKIKPYDDKQRKQEGKSESETFETSPKLSIRLLRMPINIAYKGKSNFLPLQYSSHKLRIRTESSPKNAIKLHSSFDIIEHARSPEKPVPLSPKKYNQLTLRQIVESEQEVSDKLQLFQKIKSMKEKLKEVIRASHAQKQEEPLAGW